MRWRPEFRRLALALGLVLTMVVGLELLNVARADDASDCGAATAKGRVGAAQGSDVLTMSDDDLATLLDRVTAAGMWSMRIDVDWTRVEPRQGSMNWSDVDRVVDAVSARGLCPLGLVTYAPDWASDHPDASGGYFAPTDPESFAAFAGAAARRYGSRISVWEVWNEPNTVNYFKPKPDPARYGLLLAAASRAIKAVDPDATILSGGLAPAEDNGRDIAPLTFLRGMYANGSNRYFDAFAIHPYTYPALPDDPSTAAWNTAQRMWDMRTVMVDGGDSSKTVWITECGAPTGTGRRAVSDAVQADTLRQLLAVAENTPWIGAAYVYGMRDSGSDAADTEQNFGILRHDFTPKPAYDVVRGFGEASA